MTDTSLPRPFAKYPEAGALDRLIQWLSHNWIYLFGAIYGMYVILPFLAPVFMTIGWEVPGRTIYLIYSFLCHQFPERSYFFFGSKLSYSLAEIQAAWQNTDNPLILRQFIGNPEMGWKMAWSDRMVSMFTSIWLFGLIWWPLRKRLKHLPWWGLLLFILPMVVDGGSHFISDLAGIGQGFRDSNLWLAVLTQHTLPAWFYAGDTLGSFNSWMRIATGLLVGFGFVWFAFPIIDTIFRENAEYSMRKLEYARTQYSLFQSLRNQK